MLYALRREHLESLTRHRRHTCTQPTQFETEGSMACSFWPCNPLLFNSPKGRTRSRYFQQTGGIRECSGGFNFSFKTTFKMHTSLHLKVLKWEPHWKGHKHIQILWQTTVLIYIFKEELQFKVSCLHVLSGLVSHNRVSNMKTLSQLVDYQFSPS